ncbi:hypothetical protein QZH41_002150 [Actinostola sp. cb2023]|nr:hypothetical protein QZH41_002150 [Actinostola sp. cb2023]
MKFDQLVFLVFFIMVIKECYGCEGPLGMESRKIKDSQITASSYYGTFYYPWNARLHMKSVPEENGGAWASAGSYYAPHWVQIDLGSVKKVTAIATQGHPDKGQWIKTFQISSGNDPNSLALYDNGKIFTGNTDSNTVVKNIFDPPIEARYQGTFVSSSQKPQ